MTQQANRRPPTEQIPQGLSSLPWEQARGPIHRLFLWMIDNYSGLPAGFFDTDPTTIEPDDAADPGTESEGWAAADHTHAIATATATDLANANAEGSATSFARSDHTHKRSVRVKGTGSDVGTRNAIDFRTGLTTADDSGNDEVDVSVTGAPAAKGSIWSHNGTTQASLTVGANGSELVADSSQTTGLKWGPIVGRPAQFTANQNDLAISFGVNYFSTDASRDFTGFVASTVDGQQVYIINNGSFDVVLKHESASSTAANRITCPAAADLTLGANEAALLIYDTTATRWRAFEL